jgi:hypothetical protein
MRLTLDPVFHVQCAIFKGIQYPSFMVPMFLLCPKWDCSLCTHQVILCTTRHSVVHSSKTYIAELSFKSRLRRHRYKFILGDTKKVIA